MSKQKTKKPVPRAPGSAPTKSTSASTPTAEQLMHLRSLLTQAGHFPRPTGRPRHRVVDHDPIPEGHEEVALVRSDRRENSTPKQGQRFADILATKHGMIPQQIGTKSFKSFVFMATDDDGADAIDAAFEEASTGETRIVRIVRVDTPAPKGWAIEQRRQSPIDAREDAVRQLLEQLHEIVPALINNYVLPSPKVWQQVLDDNLLDEQTINDAMATLPADGEKIDSIKKAEAAARLGMRADSFSKFLAAVKRGEFPAWAHGHDAKVKDLLRENSVGQLDRERIETLVRLKAKLKASLLPTKR